MWIVSESPAFAGRALGRRFVDILEGSRVERAALPVGLRHLVDNLVPGRALYGRRFEDGEAPAKAHILALLAPVRSQFDAAIDLVRDTGGLPVFCIAGAGTGFRGHHGRSWSACLGNLHLTAIFLPERTGDRAAAALVALPSVAVCDVLTKVLCLPACGIKWVNDVMLDDSKVAGVLAHTSFRGERAAAIVYGVGLNVEVTPTIAIDPAVPSAISICDCASSRTLADFSLELMHALQWRMEQWSREGGAPLIDAYREAALVVGRRVEILKDPRPRHDWEVSLSHEVLRRGKVVRLDDELQLHLDDSNPEPVRAGRLRFLPEVAE